jgi:hypothetical protein
MPRMTRRSSVSVSEDASRALASSALAAAGSWSTSCSTAPSVMPMATSRACVPSCRSRSILRISAAWESVARLRVRLRWVTWLARRLLAVAPSSRSLQSAYRRSPWAGSSRNTGASVTFISGSSTSQRSSRQVAGSVISHFQRSFHAGMRGVL